METVTVRESSPVACHMVKAPRPDLVRIRLAREFADEGAACNSLSGSGVHDTAGDPLGSIPDGTIFSLSSATNVLVLEGTSAGGDSGGTAFADFGNGFELVGIVP